MFSGGERLDDRPQQPSSELGNASGAGLEIGGRESTDAGPQCASTERAGVGMDLFATGPSSSEWPELLVRYPWLRPAIAQAETKSHLCGMADGLADLVDGERTDALRATGNGVVAIQGAAMLLELIRRAR